MIEGPDGIRTLETSNIGASPVDNRSNSNAILGGLCVLAAVLVAFVWVPLDVDSGVVEQVRRRVQIGDSLAPVTAAVFIAIGGLLLLFVERRSPDQPVLTLQNVRFIGISAAIIVAGFLIMRFTGPLTVDVVNWLTGDDLKYRLLRDSAPWKFIGYFIGGIFVVAGLMTQAEGGLTRKNLGIATAVVIALILIFDVPFDDLLLPPNGDV